MPVAKTYPQFTCLIVHPDWSAHHGTYDTVESVGNQKIRVLISCSRTEIGNDDEARTSRCKALVVEIPYTETAGWVVKRIYHQEKEALQAGHRAIATGMLDIFYRCGIVTLYGKMDLVLAGKIQGCDSQDHKHLKEIRGTVFLGCVNTVNSAHVGRLVQKWIQKMNCLEISQKAL